MKRISIYLFLVVSSFFVFATFAHADTTYNFVSSNFDELLHIDDMVSLADNFLITNPTYSRYIIYRYKNSSRDYYYAVFYSGNSAPYLINFNNNNYRVNIRASGFYYRSYDSSFTQLETPAFTSSASFLDYFSFSSNSTFAVLYSSFDLLPQSSSITNDIVHFVYNDITYNVLNDGTNPFPSLYDLKYYYDNYTPPDDTPLLSSFVSLVLDRLSYICDFFTSSYVFLAMFVIFIFYFVIYFFRRFL